MLCARTIAVAALLIVAVDVARAEPAQPNPAAALCLRNGATVTAETAQNGSHHGVCVFPNGSRIDEGAYFRNKHRGH